MILTVQVDGGFAIFPGLNAARRVDTASLPADEGMRVETLAAAARVWDLPENPGTSSIRSADCRTFVLTVEDGARTHRVRVMEPVKNAPLSSLLQILLKRRDE